MYICIIRLSLYKREISSLNIPRYVYMYVCVRNVFPNGKGRVYYCFNLQSSSSSSSAFSSSFSSSFFPFSLSLLLKTVLFTRLQQEKKKEPSSFFLRILNFVSFAPFGGVYFYTYALLLARACIYICEYL